MKKQDFKVTFLSDIVLNKTSNTQGKIQRLDFITGSAFLGIAVSKMEYNFNLFHSGNVRFGEATPLYNEKPSFKVPFSFFNPKFDLDKCEVRNNHFIDYKNQVEKDKQYKQIRSGYMSEDFEFFELDYNYTQKSAYDAKLRRSLDSSMFGYEAIKKGTTWKFTLKFNENLDVQNIINALCGKCFLGKSKTAEYGLINIEKLGQISSIKTPEFQAQDLTYLYVDSSLALFDENDMPTFKPTKASLGIKDGEIEWSKTQIRTKIYTPYISIRQGNDSSRLVIEKGSVIAIKNASKLDLEKLSNGVGGFLSEGYGELLINPDFLLKKEKFKLKKVDYKYENIQTINIKKDENLINFLNNRENKKVNFETLGEKVDEFKHKHSGKFHKISNSQWGNIRMMAHFIQDKDECFKEIENFITHGTSSSKWQDVKEIFIEEIKQHNLEFVKLLAMKMAQKDEK